MNSDLPSANAEASELTYEESAQRSVEDRLYIAGWCLFLAAGILYFLKQRYFPDIVISQVKQPCLLWSLTGYYCPGCGGTRSVEALFLGKFLVCAGDYPLTAYAALMYVWFMISHSLQKISKGKLRVGLKWRTSYLWIALGILIAHTIIKNLIYIITGASPFLS